MHECYCTVVSVMACILFALFHNHADNIFLFQRQTLTRHRHESTALHATHKLEWEWCMKECDQCDYRCTPDISNQCVPIVHVEHDFDLLPT